MCNFCSRSARTAKYLEQVVIATEQVDLGSFSYSEGIWLTTMTVNFALRFSCTLESTLLCINDDTPPSLAVNDSKGHAGLEGETVPGVKRKSLVE